MKKNIFSNTTNLITVKSKDLTIGVLIWGVVNTSIGKPFGLTYILESTKVKNSRGPEPSSKPCQSVAVPENVEKWNWGYVLYIKIGWAISNDPVGVANSSWI